MEMDLRIAVVSDSHGNINNLMHAYIVAVEELGADVFIHLGDNYKDMDNIWNTKAEIIRVPGTRCPQYSNANVPNRIIHELEGWRFLLSHTPEWVAEDLYGDINPVIAARRGEVDVLLHGHSHIPKAEVWNRCIRICPGNLVENNYYTTPTFCIIGVSTELLHVRIYDLNNTNGFTQYQFTRNDLRRAE